MAAWIPLITQAVPLIIPILAPFLLKLFEAITGWMGKAIPDTIKPALNAALGGVLSYVAGADPSLGVITAHVVRSGLEHESPPPPNPPATAAGKDATQGA